MDAVWILGEKYNQLTERDDLDYDIRSRIWLTYRRDFSPIRASGLTSDTGWGCMHRCGQMMLAECFIRLNLGRDWRWNPQSMDEKYWNILKMFQDRRSAMYSIHSISLMGNSSDKCAGTWFGPSTIANVIKRLVRADKNTELYVHVTIEDGVIVDEIKSMCIRDGASKPDYQLPVEKEEAVIILDSDNEEVMPEKAAEFSFFDKGDNEEKVEHASASYDAEEFEIIDTDFDMNEEPWHPQMKLMRHFDGPWTPLLLVIPLRLGLNELNMIYLDALRAVFHIPHCVGMLGGSPRHAVWIIGVSGNEVICLDPHTTQQAARFTTSVPLRSDDESFHCPNYERIAIKSLDPSLAFCFICPMEEDFDSLCELLRKNILSKNVPLFEINATRPSFFPHKMTEANMMVSKTSTSSFTPTESSRETSNTSPELVEKFPSD